MKSFPLLLALLTVGLSGPDCIGEERSKTLAPPFLGETLRYAMTFMGVAGGEMTLSARETQLDGKHAYKFEMSALSNDFVSKVFLVRDYIASWIDPFSFRSLRFEKHTVEGKRVRDDLIEFDYAQGVARREGEAIAIENPAFDSLSSVYYIRTLDLDHKGPIELEVVSRQRYSLRVEVGRREMVKTPAGLFRTIRVEPKTSAEGLIGKGRNLVLWLTDDERKIPVQLRTRLKVGTLLGKLKSIEMTESRVEGQKSKEGPRWALKGQ